MPDFNETAEFVRRWSDQMRDVIALGAALKEIGSIDLARTEQQAAFDKVNADFQAATDSLAAVRAEHKTFLAVRDKDLEAHRVAAAQIIAQANLTAAQIKAAADASAKSTVDAAQADVDRIMAAHAEAVAAAEAEIADAKKQLDGVHSELDTAQEEHQALQEKIQTIKEFARTALGT